MKCRARGVEISRGLSRCLPHGGGGLGLWRGKRCSVEISSGLSRLPHGEGGGGAVTGLYE